MKRRDLLKTTIATIGAGSLALSGCSKSDNTSSDVIIPKQTAQYEFSAPLPFNYKTIDELAEFNSTIKKSQIKRLYNNLPLPLSDKFNHWVSVSRDEIRYGNSSIKSLDDFGQYVKYAFDKGFEFTYLMNSPKSFTRDEYLTFKDDFLQLLDYLKKIGVKDIKVGSNQIIDMINGCAPNDFNLQVSTCYEIHNISQYKNLFKIYPNFGFKLVDITHDENQNFELFKSFKKMFPERKIEVLVNDGCIKRCPARVVHNQEPSFCKFNCQKLRQTMGSAHYLVKSGTIFPWDIEYYSVLGINDLKFIPRHQGRADFHNLDGLKKMLSIIENGYENYTWKDLHDADWIMDYAINDKNKDVKLSDIAPLFPSMEHFIKYGDKCAINCEAQCNYCMECAKKLEKVLLIG